MRGSASAAGFCRRAGYTIIESAIVMAVVGIMIGSFATAYNIYLKTQQAQKTDSNASIVVGALDNYLIQTGSYPCPARSSADRNDPDYGIATNCADTSIAVGTCSTGATGGLCIETSNRLPALTSPRVRRGMVPFRTLGIPEEIAEDGYKTRFDYVLTEALGVPATYNQKSGGIDLQNQLGESIQKAPTGSTGGAIHYLVIGKGPDKRGGYSRFGQQFSACPVGDWDADNCSTSGRDYFAIYRMAPYSTSAGAEHFDDYVKFSSAVETPLWKIADSAGAHINDLIGAGPLPTDGKVGIGTTPDAVLSPTLEVAGKLHVENDTHANELCPSGTTAAGCFPVAHNLACDPATPYVTGISNGNVVCAADMTVGCGPGQIVDGILPSGAVRCKTVVNCPVQAKTVCNWTGAQTTYSVPSGYQTATWQTPVTGYSFQRTFVCGAGGNWLTQSDTGLCECNVVDETYDVTCNSQMSGNWTGSITVHHTHTCPDNIDTVTNVAAACTCTPDSYSWTQGCPTWGFSGQETWQQDWTCSDATTGSWGPATKVGDTCACVPDSYTSDGSCPTGYSGAITYQYDYTCPAASWSVNELSRSCTCTGATDYQTIGCVAPLTGSRDQVRNYDCVADDWGPWTTYQDNCGSVVYTWRDVSTQTGPYGSALPNSKGNTCSPQGSVSPCSSSAGGGQYWHYPTCECQ